MSDSPTTRAVSDPLIDEVRAIRREISERFGNDVDQLCDHLQELERLHGEWIIAEEPGAGTTTTSQSGT
jgi:hypothetical protein